eukprot:783637-Rhodomonas_salina.3
MSMVKGQTQAQERDCEAGCDDNRHAPCLTQCVRASPLPLPHPPPPPHPLARFALARLESVVQKHFGCEMRGFKPRSTPKRKKRTNERWYFLGFGVGGLEFPRPTIFTPFWDG